MRVTPLHARGTFIGPQEYSRFELLLCRALPLADQFLEVLPFGRSQFDDIASLAHLRLRRSGRDKSESFIPYDLVDAAY
jgi:hypothetical protein